MLNPIDTLIKLFIHSFIHCGLKFDRLLQHLGGQYDGQYPRLFVHATGHSNVQWERMAGCWYGVVGGSVRTAMRVTTCLAS